MFHPLTIVLGSPSGTHVQIDVLDYEHPERAEPAGLDLMRCLVTVQAGPVQAPFEMSISLYELFEVHEYLRSIGSGNGPSRNFGLAGGLLGLSFAPSRRGPVLCAVLVKTIDASHVRLEFLVTLEPEDITRALFALTQLQAHAQNQARP